MIEGIQSASNQGDMVSIWTRCSRSTWEVRDKILIKMPDLNISI